MKSITKVLLTFSLMFMSVVGMAQTDTTGGSSNPGDTTTTTGSTLNPGDTTNTGGTLNPGDTSNALYAPALNFIAADENPSSFFEGIVSDDVSSEGGVSQSSEFRDKDTITIPGLGRVEIKWSMVLDNSGIKRLLVHKNFLLIGDSLDALGFVNNQFTQDFVFFAPDDSVGGGVEGPYYQQMLRCLNVAGVKYNECMAGMGGSVINTWAGWFSPGGTKCDQVYQAACNKCYAAYMGSPTTNPFD